MSQPNDFNPYQPPGQPSEAIQPTPELGELLHQLTGIEFNTKKAYTVYVHPHWLLVESEDVSRQEVPREEISAADALINGFALTRILKVPVKGKPLLLQFEPDDFEKVQNWVGPLTKKDMKKVLSQGTTLGIVIGALMTYAFFPTMANGTIILEDPIGFGIGFIILAFSLGSRFVTHRIFFLLNAVLSFLLIIFLILPFIITDGAWGWALVIPLNIIALCKSVKDFFRFADVQD